MLEEDNMEARTLGVIVCAWWKARHRRRRRRRRRKRQRKRKRKRRKLH